LDFNFTSLTERFELILNANLFSVSINISFSSKISKLILNNFENEFGFIKPFSLFKIPPISKFPPESTMLIFLLHLEIHLYQLYTEL